MKAIYKQMKSYLWLAYIIFLPLLSSCTEDTTITTSDSTPVPVIYGAITDHYVRQQIDLSSSTGYFDKSQNKRISNAIVTLQEDSVGISHSYTLAQDSVGSGIYMTANPIAGRPGWKYKLTVNMDFNQDGTPETYMSECIMPQKLNVDSVNVTKMKEASYTVYSLNISAQDPGNQKNYYFCKYSVNDSLHNEISKYIVFDDLGLDGMYVKDLAIWHFFDKSNKSKFSDQDAAEMVFLSGGDKINAEVSNITKGYSDFIISCQSQKDGSNPFFGGPPANIPTNISNGARGYFTAYATSSAKCVVPTNFTAN